MSIKKRIIIHSISLSTLTLLALFLLVKNIGIGQTQTYTVSYCDRSKDYKLHVPMEHPKELSDEYVKSFLKDVVSLLIFKYRGMKYDKESLELMVAPLLLNAIDDPKSWKPSSWTKKSLNHELDITSLRLSGRKIKGGEIAFRARGNLIFSAKPGYEMQNPKESISVVLQGKIYVYKMQNRHPMGLMLNFIKLDFYQNGKLMKALTKPMFKGEENE